VLSGLLLALVVVADLALSPRYMRSVRAAVASGDMTARTRMYRLTVALAWSIAVAALIVLLVGGLTPADIGFRLPDVDALGPYSGVLAGAVVGLVGGAVAAVLRARSGKAVPLLGDVDVMLPQTRRERRWYAAVAVTAGTTEEVFFRALALTFLLAVLPGESEWPAVAVAAVLFGLGHAYQGLVGMVTTAVLAFLLGALYLATESLLPGMALHTLIDLRVLLLPHPSPDPAPATG